jgi:hypothetical protein
VRPQGLLRCGLPQQFDPLPGEAAGRNGPFGKLSQLGHGCPEIPAEPETLHDLLLQKSDGTFELLVWSELLTGTSEVTVDLGGLHGKVRVYDPTSGTTATQTLNNVHSVRLTLSDHPVVIELP